jgi:hypothetical protein
MVLLEIIYSQFNDSLDSPITKAAGYRLEEWESIPDKDKYFLSDGVCRWGLGPTCIHIERSRRKCGRSVNLATHFPPVFSAHYLHSPVLLY